MKWGVCNDHRETALVFSCIVEWGSTNTLEQDSIYIYVETEIIVCWNGGISVVVWRH